LLLMLAAGGGLFVLAAPVIQVLFEHGRFHAEDTARLVPVLRAYLWSLPAAALIGLAARACQASGNLRGPAKAAVAAIPVNLGLDLWLLPRYGVAGAGYATAVALSFQFVLLTRMLGVLELAPICRVARLPVLVIPGLSASLAAWACTRALADGASSPFGLVLAIGAGLIAAVVAVRFLLPNDFAQLISVLRRRRSR
jgi:putative peptidoglycan lipid II flippase